MPTKDGYNGADRVESLRHRMIATEARFDDLVKTELHEQYHDVLIDYIHDVATYEVLRILAKIFNSLPLDDEHIG